MRQLVTAQVEVAVDTEEPAACHPTCEYLKAQDAYCFLFQTELVMGKMNGRIIIGRCSGCMGSKKKRGRPKKNVS